MKKNKYLLLVAASALAITGCNQDELEIPQKGVISFEDFYQTDEDAESAVTIVYATTQKLFSSNPAGGTGYNYGPYFGTTNWMGDDIWFGGTGTDDCVDQREFHQFIHNADYGDVGSLYEALYTSILKCNYVINNFTEERLGSLSKIQKKCVAEARTMRAFDYLLLGIYWGNPAIVETVLTAADQPGNAESQEAVMNWVIKEAELAAEDLEWRKSTDDYEGAVRITKGFALAVKGKAQLWKEDYAGAKATFEEIMNQGCYALVPSDKMITIGHADGKGSSEIIFEFNYDGTNLTGEYDRVQRGGWNDHNTFCMFRGGLMNGGHWVDSCAYVGGWEWLNPSKYFIDVLLENDGMESARRKAWVKSYDEILYDCKWDGDGDNFTPGKTAAKEKDKNRGVAANQYVYANIGWWQYKLGAHPNQGDQLSDSHLNRNATIMRYAEVLLMYAEACAQLGEKSGKGLEALNAIQKRAQSKTVSSELTLKAVQTEKLLEMWMEGCRFVDLVRWSKKDESVLANLVHQDDWLPTFVDLINGPMGEYTSGSDVHKGVICEQIKDMEATYYKDLYGADLGFKKGKHEFLPFPQRAVDLNPNLVQHEGW